MMMRGIAVDLGCVRNAYAPMKRAMVLACVLGFGGCAPQARTDIYYWILDRDTKYSDAFRSVLRANAVAVFFYQVIKSLRVACCGDESIAGFEYSLRNVSAQTARA